MALTPGFKKFIGLVVVAGAVGGGIFYWKTMPKKAPVPEVAIEQQAETPVTQNVAQPVTVQPQEIVQAPPATQVQPAPQADASSNRGMKFLLNQGQK